MAFASSNQGKEHHRSKMLFLFGYKQYYCCWKPKDVSSPFFFFYRPVPYTYSKLTHHFSDCHFFHIFSFCAYCGENHLYTLPFIISSLWGIPQLEDSSWKATTPTFSDITATAPKGAEVVWAASPVNKNLGHFWCLQDIPMQQYQTTTL